MQQNAKKASPLLRLLIEAGGSRDFFIQIRSIFWDGTHLEMGLAILSIFVLLGAFVGWVIIGLNSAVIASDRIGLYSSEYRGDWQFDDQAVIEYWYREALYRRKKEEQASQYARNCYNLPYSADTLACRVFY